MLKPKPVCIVGIPGSGKTTLVKEYQLRRPDVLCLTGSSVIAQVIKPLTLLDYKKLPNDEKFYFHEKALQYLRDLYLEDLRLIIVDGHLSFQIENSNEFEEVFTDSDNKLYGTLILLNPPVDVVREHRINDTGRLRSTLPDDIIKHAEYEANLARNMALKHGFVLFEIETPDLEKGLQQLDFAINHVLKIH
jgi:adenylate kinase